MPAHARAKRPAPGAPTGRPDARGSRADPTRRLLACLALLACSAALAQPARSQVADLPVEAVVIGDKGYGVTAGAGNRLERFAVEVLAVQWDGGSGFPLVLVRASGPFIEAAGGVAAGMSGSPVYIATEGGDALLGAIGYVFPRAAHDLALVTPISAMRRTTGGQLPPFVEVPGVGEAARASTPVLMTGVSSRALALMTPLFRSADVTAFPVQGGGSSGTAGDEATYALQPGAPLAVSLAWGDVAMQAVGTITAVEGDDVIAFGHPFLGMGAVSLPITPAYVTAIVPSSDVPFKLANVGSSILGAIEQDRPGSISGRLGATPRTLHVDLSVVGVGQSANYSFAVPADDRLYPTLVGTGVLSLLDRHLAATTAGYAEIAWEIALRGGERVNVIEQTNAPDDIAYRAAVLALTPLAILADNEFRESGVDHVSIAVRLEDRQRVATLEEAIAEESVVTAGENVVIHLRLQPYRQNAIVRTISVPVPDDVEGELTVLIRGGDVPRDTGDAHVDEQEVDKPRSFPELLDALRQQVQASELIVEAVTESGEVRRLSRTPFAFVVDGNEDLTITVTPSDQDAGSGTPTDEGAPASGGTDD